MIKFVFFSLGLLLAFAACAGKPVIAEAPDTYDPGPEWALAWSDEFDGDALDTSRWNYDLGAGGWGNFELQGYTSNTENITVKNGKLIIRALRDDSSLYFPFSSARIHTKGKFSFRYGRIAARIRLPYGQGVWPAFWMMGANKSEAGWPRCGEIDIMEIRGGDVSDDSILHGTVHWFSPETSGPLSSGQSVMNTHNSQPDGNPVPFHLNFHVFEAVWTPESITMKYDGKEYYTLDIHPGMKDMAAFHKKFYILLNMAVGGKFTGIASAMEITNTFPQAMAVDWVRVYQKK